MYRFADRELHSYVFGVYNDKENALQQAQEERMNRGGNKYWPEVLEMNINENTNHKIIMGLDEK